MSRVRRLLPSILFCGGRAIGGARPRATEPRATLIGVEDRIAPRPLREAIGDAPAPPASLADARRRARDAAQQAEALLRSEGYYDAEVTDEVTESDPPKALVRVTPGPRFHFKGGGVEWVGGGPGSRRRRRGAAGSRACPRALLGGPRMCSPPRPRPSPRLRPPDTPTRRPNLAGSWWITTTAAWRRRSAFRAGQITHLGVVRVSGRSRTGAAFVRRLAPWRSRRHLHPGQAGQAGAAADRRRRLRRRLREPGGGGAGQTRRARRAGQHGRSQAQDPGTGRRLSPRPRAPASTAPTGSTIASAGPTR